MISVIIPTLQKNKELLYSLIDNLDYDNSVGEIIIIDNSLKGIEYLSEKVRVITPKENLFVNPSWNLGVREAKYDIIALLNDDIVLCDNFCSAVVSKMKPDMGIIGFNSEDYMIVCNKFDYKPQKNELSFEPIKYMDKYFGIVMFFYRAAYTPIPNEMKVTYGDNWLLHHARKKNRVNYRINGQNILHVGSLSSSNPKLKPICKNDSKIYKKLTLSLMQRIFSIEETWDVKKIRFLGLTYKIKK